MALPLLLLQPGLLLRTLHPRVPQPLLSLSIATETLTIDAVRAYTKPDELLEHLQQLDNEGNNHLQRLLATSYVCNGEHVLAEPFVSAALAEDPHDIEMRFLQGVALEKRGEAEAALDAYEAVLEGDPKHWRALFHVGKISMSVGWVEDAREYFEQVLEIEPSHLPTQEIVERLKQLDTELVGEALSQCEDEPAPPVDMPPMPFIDLEL
eukprot:CAMPEP_0181225046 /NCGR_PEP_ID=MMETSP1096-20121128/31472_1 /TAXON_ID=156174 ORGANISM="Chrysochromulina ericina, Strain CCMP281" /NCGR_SAMPLE_ID=MMETSP1096 /ASSEMBLY_ACC=CAM_ASM_000453 /LENGTH=208 /DNA_ID=CAMNT_0023318211 /DNA_START=12 /DNA_END=638 /DNA_ORIENTATION=+